MKGLLEYVGSIFVTLVPPRYRTSTTLRGPAMASGIAQTVIMLSLLVLRLALFSREADVFHQSGLSPEIIYGAVHNIGERAAYGSGIFLIVNFMFRPLNIFILYLALEGLVRTMGALVGHQVFGTLPLYAISGIHGLIDRQKYKEYIGELVPDHVVQGGEKQGYEKGTKSHPFVYYLRKASKTRPAVVIRKYDR